MKCPHCGMEVERDERVCPYCYGILECGDEDNCEEEQGRRASHANPSKAPKLLITLLAALVVLAIGLYSAGVLTIGGPELADFSLANGTASIALDKTWDCETDLEADYMLVAGARDGTKAVFIFQFPKDGSLGVRDMAAMKALVRDSYNISDETEIEPYSVSGLYGVSAYICNVNNPDSGSCQARMVYGESDYAFYTIGYIADQLKDRDERSFKRSLAAFKEQAPQMEDGTSVETTDTIRWFNASYAVLTEINGWDYTRFGGMAANENTRLTQAALLETWWNVTDRQSADENLDWILSEGHRLGFAEDMEYLTKEGIATAEDKKAWLLDNFDVDDRSAENWVECYEMYEEFGPGAIDGWDYCRALNLMSYYYIAGYYTETEALDKSLEIARQVQGIYSSWDELIASYMRGYVYWAEESSGEREAVYNDLKSRPDGPYEVAFDMELEKTW